MKISTHKKQKTGVFCIHSDTLSFALCMSFQRAWLALHILTEVKNVTILKGMFLCKIVSSEELVVVVALHIFESDCYNCSLWESRKYGGPEVVKFMFKNCKLHFSSVGYSYSMIQPYMSI